ncbi:MAG: hypothetical protein L0H83_07240 [Salinisphaera sp.]|nr:hypothetical protein [Salinisphaera sp.]
MNKTECSVRFLTPAFLGDANQSAAWRTPPFKAQLRQFWRMVMAGRGRGHGEIRRIEALLFGHAWLKDEDPRKSRVRLRLDKWQRGTLAGGWPEVGKIENGKASVDAGLYLGYGAVEYDKNTKGTKLTHAPAIDANQSATLRIGWRNDEDGQPPQGADALSPALALMNRYGTIGGRSRNGWGSYALESDTLPPLETHACLIEWREALRDSWAQGIGRDEEGSLVWRTESGENWQPVMKSLARLRSDLNQQFRSSSDRSLLSWPVTKKELPGWGSNDRLPNSLRFKVVEKQGQLHGLVFHVPCRPKDDSDNNLWGKHPYDQAGLERLWARVHQQLDQNFPRVSA